MDTITLLPEVQFEFKKEIESQFQQLANAYAEMNDTNLKAVVRFSPDLRIVAVDLETVSTIPFYMNLDILKTLEEAIEFVADHQFLTAQGFEVVERAVVDANGLNALGRLHRENTPLPYHTTQAYIFRTPEENLESLLLNIEQKLEARKAAPDYIERIKFTPVEHKTLNPNDMPDMNFVGNESTKQYKLHDATIFGGISANKDVNGYVATLSKEPVKHRNQVVMGVTIDLRNIKTGRTAILHIPYQFMDEYAPQPSARITGESLPTSSFVYYEWFTSEDRIVSHLQKGTFNTRSKQLEEYVKSLVRYDIEVVDIKLHSFDFDIPTANHAPITEVAFVAVLPNHHSLFESLLVRVDQSGEVKLFNSRGLAVYPPDSAIQHLHNLKADAQELFQSNRLYTFDQIKQFRKKLGGFNNGLSVKNEHVYLP